MVLDYNFITAELTYKEYSVLMAFLRAQGYQRHLSEVDVPPREPIHLCVYRSGHVETTTFPWYYNIEVGPVPFNEVSALWNLKALASRL